MKLAELQFGISRLEDGTRVLTPLGPFGKVYEYSDITNARYRAAVRALTVLVAAVPFAIVPLQSLRGMNPGNTLEALTLGIVGLECTRGLLTWTVFRRATPVAMTPSMQASRATLAYFGFFRATLLIASAILGALAIFGLVMDLASGRNEYAGLAPWLWIILVGIYSVRLINARFCRKRIPAG